MTRNLVLLACCIAAFGCADMRSQPEQKATLSKAANPDVPQGTPIWKQGMQDNQTASTLAPHPAKLTVTPEGDIPVANIKLPPGFKAEVWASGMPGARMMARGSQGTLWIGTRGIGRVYEVKDSGGKRTSRILIDKLTQPNGVAFKDGTLYVMAIDKFLRYDGIEKNPNVTSTSWITATTAPIPKPHDLNRNVM